MWVALFLYTDTLVHRARFAACFALAIIIQTTKCIVSGLHRIRPPVIIRTQRREDGARLCRPAPVESVVKPILGYTYVAKPYANGPGWCLNYAQNVRYSISITGKMTGKGYAPTEMIIRGLPGWLAGG